MFRVIKRLTGPGVNRRCQKARILRSAFCDLYCEIERAGIVMERVGYYVRYLRWTFLLRVPNAPDRDKMLFKVEGTGNTCRITVITFPSGQQNFKTLPHRTNINDVVGKLTSLLVPTNS
jgi:hypothetical protein